MDDQTWEALAAEIDAGPVEVAPESPVGETVAVGLQDTTSSPDANGPDAASVVAAEAPTETSELVPDPAAQRLAELEAREAEIAQREAVWQQRAQAAAELVRRAEAEKLQRAEQEDTERAETFYDELKQTDPEWAEQFQGHRNFLAMDRHNARLEAAGTMGAFESFIMAAQYHAPDLMDKIKADAELLTQYPSTEQKQHMLQLRKDAVQSNNAEVSELRRELQEVRLRLEAATRPEGADTVDGGQSGPGGSDWQSRWNNATGFDETFALIEERLPAR